MLPVVIGEQKAVVVISVLNVASVAYIALLTLLFLPSLLSLLLVAVGAGAAVASSIYALVKRTEGAMEVLFSERATAGRPLSWGDTHHPEFDRQNAEYVGRWLFIGDKVNGRAAAISLLDFETKDIVKIPNVQTIHGGAFTTPNTEYVLYATQYPAPWEPGRGYKPGVTKVPWSQVVKDEKYFWEYMEYVLGVAYPGGGVLEDKYPIPPPGTPHGLYLLYLALASVLLAYVWRRS